MPPLSPSKSSLSWHKLDSDDDEDENTQDSLPLLETARNAFQNVSLLPEVQFVRPSASISALPFQPMATRSGSNAFEMRSRSKKNDDFGEAALEQAQMATLNPSFVLVDIPIEQGDTLPSFAIKYHVTTSELKRLNSMFHDQDFHSRQRLRVPIHKYGILAERFLRLPDSNPHDEASTSSSSHVLLDFSSQPGTPSPSNSGTPTNGEVMRITPTEHAGPPSAPVRSAFTSQSRAARLFLQDMDRNLQRLAKEALDRRPRSPISEEDLLNSRHRVEPLPPSPLNDGLGCETADCGISLKALLCMILLLSIVLPGAFLIYKLYCLHHPGFCPDPNGASPVVVGNRSMMEAAHDHHH
ncbi:hypothetical protein BV898_03395 [Hypsibius exemplaris]|uniref:LysM domain-containing protein n=1 Tax=Hypsibius exemplaris TaxID=2072580 RepID=A0A1W0X4Y6_HYPEX|nr:hypothetical protein BV898_03395 [Hypsibius exemplaris]